MVDNDYDAIAQQYSDSNDTDLQNAYYERPATLNLLGDVAGQRVLDAGCGSGPLMALLQEAGATVSGFDASKELIRIAEGRLGAGTDLQLVDISQQFPYDDNMFDAAACSLVLHYFNDWSAPLAEFRRVLKPGGRLVVSVTHPMIYKLINPKKDYFDTVSVTEKLKCNGASMPLTIWHRPLHALCDEFADAGFTIRRISEPPFDPNTPKNLIPRHFKGRTAFVGYLFFLVENPTD